MYSLSGGQSATASQAGTLTIIPSNTAISNSGLRHFRTLAPTQDPDQRSETIADALWENVFSRFSFPEKLLTDRGKNVHSSELIQRLCERAKVSKIATSPYHAATDGQCERMMRWIAACLRIFAD